MPVTDCTEISNRDFFYSLARPGMVGLVGAAGPGRLMSAGVRWLAGGALRLGRPASYWSHVFLVLDRQRTSSGWDVTIIESTIVNRFHRTSEGRRLPGFPGWNGPQIARLIHRDAHGRPKGAKGRKRMRQYIDDEFTPNVALIDLELKGENLAQCRRTAHRLLNDRHTYYKREIVGLVCAALNDKLMVPNPLDMSGLHCTAFIRACLDDMVPAFSAIRANPRNTFPEHLYQAALKADYDIYQIVRERLPTGMTGLSSRMILQTAQLFWTFKALGPASK